MTIRRGQDWGEQGRLSLSAAAYHGDAEASAALQSTYSGVGILPDEIGLLGGDLHRTLGGPDRDEGDLRAGRGMRFTIDVGIVQIDGGEPIVMLSHLVARQRPRRRLFDGPLLVVMNAAFVGALNLGPRAHPNDGRLDVTSGMVDRADRRSARRRALTGSHVPHPGLEELRITSSAFELEPEGMYVEIDHRAIGRARHIEITCLPDALAVVV